MAAGVIEPDASVITPQTGVRIPTGLPFMLIHVNA